MKTKLVVAILTAASSLALVSQGLAQATAVQSGNYSDPATWGGSEPIPGQALNIPFPYIVTVDIDATNVNVAGGGGLVMGPNSLLVLTGDGPFSGFTNLNATAIGNTIIYTGNPFTTVGGSVSTPNTYYNLTLQPGGAVGVYDNVPVSVAGTLTMNGSVFVNQPGVNSTAFYINNLVINSNAQFNCGGSPVIVTNMTIVNSSGYGGSAPYGTYPGGLIDAWAEDQNLENQFGNVTVTTNGVWFLGDVVQWAVGGNLTNNGVIAYTNTGSARITFDGTGVVTGNSFQVPAISFYGTNTFLTSIMNLVPDFFTNYSVVTFDIGQPATIYNTSTNFVYNGTLNLIDSGAPPANNTMFQLFDAMSYGGSFVNITSSFNFVNNLSTSGSITFTGSAPAALKITSISYNRTTEQYTLTWSSAPSVSYSVEETPSLNGTPVWSTLATGVPSGGATTSKTVTVPGGQTGFLRVSQP